MSTCSSTPLLSAFDELAVARSGNLELDQWIPVLLQIKTEEVAAPIPAWYAVSRKATVSPIVMDNSKG